MILGVVRRGEIGGEGDRGEIEERRIDVFRMEERRK